MANMFTVFSDLTDPGDQHCTDIIEKEKTQIDGNHQYSNLFDGTELVSTNPGENMSQEFDGGLYLTEEELAVNLDSLLKSFPSPPYTGNDPIWGLQDLGDLCNSDSLFGTTSKLPENGMVKMEPLTPSSGLGLAGNENEIEVETSPSSTSGMESNSTINEEAVTTYQIGTAPVQQQQITTPKIAFTNNGLLPRAPPVQQNINGNQVRLVKLNPQQYQKLHAPSSYSPPPTLENSGTNSRGAQYARQYRQKNREHMEQLEAENTRLVAENDKLRRAFDQARSQNDKLSREVSYLREVLQNQSAIASILKVVSCNTAGLKFQFPVSSNNTGKSESEAEHHQRRVETRASSKRKIDDQQQQQQGSLKKLRGNDLMDGPTTSTNSGPGVCLHVNGDTVSVEFCSRCNREARCVSDQQQ